MVSNYILSLDMSIYVQQVQTQLIRFFYQVPDLLIQFFHALRLALCVEKVFSACYLPVVINVALLFGHDAHEGLDFVAVV